MSSATLTRRAEDRLRLPVLQPDPAAERGGERGAAVPDRRRTRWRITATAWTSCWSWWAWPTRPGSGPTSCRPASSSGWRWPVPWRPSPAILLADEPTGNLDYTTGSEILDLLWDSCERLGQTIVLVTHDARAAAYADRVLVVRDGEILDADRARPTRGPRGAAADPAPGRAGALARASGRDRLAGPGRPAAAHGAHRCRRGAGRSGHRRAADGRPGSDRGRAPRGAGAVRLGPAARARLRHGGLHAADRRQRMRQSPASTMPPAVSEERGRSVTTTAAGPDEKVFTMLLDRRGPGEDEAKIRTYELEAGSFLDPADPTGVLVNAGWARDNGLGLGDELLLNFRRPNVPHNHIVGLLGDAGFGALGPGSVMVLDSDLPVRGVRGSGRRCATSTCRSPTAARRTSRPRWTRA